MDDRRGGDSGAGPEDGGASKLPDAAKTGKVSPGGSRSKASAASAPSPDEAVAVLAVDTGGTFTDLILLHDGTLTALKVASTPKDPAQGVMEGVRRILDAASCNGRPSLIHGTTVATNALLERKGARVFLVTNAGFEDVIEIGRQNRPELYALSGRRAPPLVARSDRVGITGRLDADGTELAPLDPGELAGLAERVRDAEAVAVVLLHSYGDPSGEEAVALALEELTVPVSLSARILPEFREFERTSTTVANAFVAPLMDGYLSRLASEPGLGPVRIMGSGGGALPIVQAIAEPVHTVLSGPAGGVAGALDWGRRAGAKQLLSFDMGGTSTDVSLVPGALLHTREGEVGGIPIAIPLLDIHTVGAGGGSIARVDPGGALRVGPDSAGAVPGPVAYGRGGNQITVTDAHLWLGKISSDGLLGGDHPLDREALNEPMEKLARQARMSADEVAEGIIEVVDTAMERALRVISVERGVDPAEFHLVAFGGAAGLHAVELTDRLGIRAALIPPAPGLLSAYGMLVAPVVRDRSRTVFVSSDGDAGPASIPGILASLEREAVADMAAEGLGSSTLAITRSVDARYADQGFELRVPAEDWVEAFHRAHEARYGYRRSGIPVVAVTLRVRAEAPGHPVPVPPSEAESGAASRFARVGWRGEWLDTTLLPRSSIAPGTIVPGPAVLLEYSATTWCPPGWVVERDERDVLRLSRGTAERGVSASATR